MAHPDNLMADASHWQHFLVNAIDLCKGIPHALLGEGRPAVDHK